MVSFSCLYGKNRGRTAVRVFPRVATIVVIAAMALGCAMDSDPSAFPVGTWESTFGEVYEITSGTITYLGNGTDVTFRAQVVYVDDDSLNGGDSALVSGADAASNPGYAVIRYTSVNNAGTGEVGKYNVFRWADGAADGELQMTQGYRNVGGDFPDNVNGVFDSVEAARTGATNTAGYFSFASNVTEQ